VRAFFASASYLWAASVLAQAVVCGILVYRGHFRTLPFFATYITLNLYQAVFLYGVYSRYGFRSPEASAAAWWSEAITLVARAFATVEILRVALKSYRGISGLVWRLLGGISLLLLICVAIIARGDAGWALMHADRGYHMIFAAAVIACLTLIRYYQIQVAPVYKALLAGFCFYSCAKVLIDSILPDLLFQRYPNFEFIWQSLAMVSFLAVLVLWGWALRRPLPEKAERAVLPSSVYGRIVPEINYQLRAINEQLMNFWKIEEPRS
jgi:hypothetical protein